MSLTATASLASRASVALASASATCRCMGPSACGCRCTPALAPQLLRAPVRRQRLEGQVSGSGLEGRCVCTHGCCHLIPRPLLRLPQQLSQLKPKSSLQLRRQAPAAASLPANVALPLQRRLLHRHQQCRGHQTNISSIRMRWLLAARGLSPAPGAHGIHVAKSAAAAAALVARAQAQPARLQALLLPLLRWDQDRSQGREWRLRLSSSAAPQLCGRRAKSWTGAT